MYDGDVSGVSSAMNHKEIAVVKLVDFAHVTMEPEYVSFMLDG